MSGQSAPIYSIADEPRNRAESAAWARFVAADGQAEFCAAWLALLAARIDKARAALLLVAEAEGDPYSVAAVWPDPRRDLQYLGPVAQRALTERAGVVAAPDGGAASAEGPAHVAYPVEVAGRLVGAVVMDVGPGGSLQAALRQLHWASAWLLDHFGRRRLAEREAELARMATLSELMATALQHRRLRPSALAVANELAARLACDRVAIGFEQDQRVQPLALSHTASFDRRSDLVRTLGDAMDEVLDLGVGLVFPIGGDDEPGAPAHAEAARTLKLQALMSMPLVHEGQVIGVLSAERQGGEPFSAAEQQLARAIGLMLGPVWALQREREQPFWRRSATRLREALQALWGPSRPGLKLAGVTLSLLLVGAALWPAPHRVSARTVVEGSTQRAAVAPFDGFVAEGLVRAGDTVRAGQPLARLDDRDLLLERARWQAESEQLRRKLQVAMAQADRGAMGVIAAQVAQAEAQLALAQEKLSRATLIAPFDGIVVSGDLSRSAGMPVETGKLLFEVAPLQGWRVVMQVDDRDIARVALQQRGELVLSSLPDRALPFTVSAITPVASQQDGRNVFRVEARLDDGAAGRLRPGMEGIGKVVVGERSLLWIWTHGFFDAVRLALWSWLP